MQHKVPYDPQIAPWCNTRATQTGIVGGMENDAEKDAITRSYDALPEYDATGFPIRLSNEPIRLITFTPRRFGRLSCDACTAASVATSLRERDCYDHAMTHFEVDE